ncbi:MAG: UDP-N-acetylenolpyruvoylglucosamine reductase [Candidatus Moranbacteria bacterium RIFCSPHIGHO2_02_FULL_40_12b]|nr:MAG: UDP-N-acetylenolpyruvoylglucosamine reductase [Candidatus Moranbacteria bacterium RIFCSPHIGHO2_02_FULL_40_12b]
MIKLEKNISLSNYTTFRIGGPAKFFIEVKNEEELLEALDYAKKNNLDFFILGGGSNLLVSDKGFDGLVIKMHNSSFLIHNSSLECGAGVPLAKAVRESVNSGLTGLEWAAGIPGTVGGAVRGNAGAFGGNASDVVKKVSVLNTEELGIKNYELSDCNFKYRDSVFKQNKNLIILSAVFKLQKGNKEEGRKKIQEIIKKRISVQPQGMPSAGSFFVNPVVNNPKIIEEFEKETGKKSKESKVPAPWLIEQADLKGRQIGGAKVSEKHANYIVNTGNATAEDVIMLASIIKQQVRDKFGVELKEEVQYLGF